MTDLSREEKPLSRIGPQVAVDRNLPFHESLIHMLWHAVEGRPDRVAVIYQDRSITYRDFGRATNGLAALLDSFGLKSGPIAIMMPNSIEMDVAVMAAMSVGAQVAPVNPFLTVAEIGKVLDGFGVRSPRRLVSQLRPSVRAANRYRNGRAMLASTCGRRRCRRPTIWRYRFSRAALPAFRKASTIRIAA
jgi:non-ribosomal peptide synthetase component F